MPGCAFWILNPGDGGLGFSGFGIHHVGAYRGWTGLFGFGGCGLGGLGAALEDGFNVGGFANEAVNHAEVFGVVHHSSVAENRENVIDIG